ncbi:hypothetical protein [Salipiger bermudensis]|uniref:hypothetical protein n=1 Tax=Salipiger bermudensis TaxID=344736 RepID=UPI001CD4A9D8|nr:hypothetical protein [Salipiger bermudensis]MCA1288516.1 hypothetical protein [Salipiger bermudensis]
MDRLYIKHDDAAAALGWQPNELRILRRLMDCPLAQRRVSGSKALQFEVGPLIEWLGLVLPRFSPVREQRILEAARPATALTS